MDIVDVQSLFAARRPDGYGGCAEHLEIVVMAHRPFAHHGTRRRARQHLGKNRGFEFVKDLQGQCTHRKMEFRVLLSKTTF